MPSQSGTELLDGKAKLSLAVPIESEMANIYRFCANSPNSRFDPTGLCYIDLNFTGGFIAIGITFGIQIGSTGLHPYLGYALTTPGAGLSCHWSPQNPNPGDLTWQVQADLGLGGAYGTDMNGDGFYEIGIGSPGGSLSLYYTW